MNMPVQNDPHWYEDWASEERMRYPVSTFLYVIGISITAAVLAAGVIVALALWG